jgi:hypothetical protein
MSSFDWDGFNEVVAQPSAELVRRLARWLQRWEAPPVVPFSALPQAEANLIAFIRTLLAADDWYAGRPLLEACAIDRIVDTLFVQLRPRRMKLKPLSDGVSWEVLNLATGAFVLDDGRNEPRNRSIFIKRAETSPWDEPPELAAVGCRPLRHRSWDRKVAAEQLEGHNPFREGAYVVHYPEYSVHPPEQVELLRQDLARVEDGLRGALGRVKSKRAGDAALADFEENLVVPIEKAAGTQRAVFARWDY